MNQELLIAVAVPTFLAVSLVIIAVARFLNPATDPFEDRLRALVPGAAPPARPRRRSPRGLLLPFLDRIGPRTNTKRRSLGLTRTLRHAGYRQESALIVFHTLQLVIGVAGLGIGGLFLIAVRPPFLTGLALICLWGYVVFTLPVAYVRLRAAERMRAITEGLPGALDLLVICLEAGLGLDSAIVRVATELGRNNAILGGELLTVSREMQAGLPRRDALRNLSERTGVGELSSLAAILAQSDRLGTSVAQALRVQAETMRTRRRQQAEEQAAKTAVKIVFPLVFCIFPALFVVVLGPAMITVLGMFMKLTE
jgi:tight adherence protein C